jgi:hypothetical protein
LTGGRYSEVVVRTGLTVVLNLFLLADPKTPKWYLGVQSKPSKNTLQHTNTAYFGSNIGKYYFELNVFKLVAQFYASEQW